MKKAAFLVAAAAAALTVAAGTGAATPKPTLLIRHQMQGCHAWSFKGGPFHAAQSIALKHGTTIRVIDNDVMPHKLVQTAGPAVHYSGAALLSHAAAWVDLTFAKPGVYRFTTKAGEDYVKGIKTIGEDNVLTLRVVVS